MPDQHARRVDRFRTLDSFRGLASVWIAYSHILGDHKGAYGGMLDFLQENAFLGTEVFFVISGFGISASALRIITNNESPLAFIGSRTKRIYTTYLFSLLFTAVLAPVAIAFISAARGSPLVVSLADYSVVDWILLATLAKIFTAPDWQHLYAAFLPVNGSYWFIAVIIQIYLVVALLLRLRGQSYKAVYLLSALSIASLLPAVRALLPCGLFLPFWPHFLVGVILFYAVHARRTLDLEPPGRRALHHVALATFLVGVAVAVCCLQAFSQVRLIELRTLCAVATGLLFWLLHPVDHVLSRTRVLGFFARIGAFSYSLYLMHLPISRVVRPFVRAVLPVRESISYPLALMPLVIGLSYVWYLFFEEPGSLRRTATAVVHPVKTVTGRSASGS